MGPSKKVKRIRLSPSVSRSASPLLDPRQKISTKDLLSETRANELRELIQMLLETFDGAPQALLVMCERISLHPDPGLVETVERLCRDARLKHCEFLEKELVRAFPVHFPSMVVNLSAPILPPTQRHILQEARIQKDRCQRAIVVVHRLASFYDCLELVLRERAKMDATHDSRWWTPHADLKYYPATNGLLSHVLLINNHMAHMESLLERLTEFWEEYLSYLGPIDLDQDVGELESWDMAELFQPVEIRSSEFYTKLSLCPPKTRLPKSKFVQHK